MEDFCGSQFWDTDLSWNTENSTKSPDLTPCFQNTVLVWIPCGFLWIFSALNFLYNYRSRFNVGSSSTCDNGEIGSGVSSTREKNMGNGLASKKVKIVRSTNKGIVEDARDNTTGAGTGTGSNGGPIQWNAFNVSKVVFCLFLILTQIVRLHVSISWELEESHPVDIYTPIVRIATYVLALTSIIISKNKGNCSSIIQFAFWSLLALCQFFKFRTTLLHVYDRSQNNNDSDNITLEQEDTPPIITIILEFFDYILIIVQFLLHCWADSNPTLKKIKIDNVSDNKTADADGRLQCPEHSASALSSLLFSWFDTLAWKGFNKPLETKDMWELNRVDTAQELSDRFEKSWKSKQEVKNRRYISKNLKNSSSARVEVQQVGVSSVIWSVFGPSLLAGFSLVMVPTLLVFVSPKVLSALIAFMSSEEDTWKGYFYAGLLFVISFVSTICTCHYQHIMFTLGMRVKSALTCALYKKILVISNSARKESTAGEIVNLMSVDVNNVSQLITFIQILWTSPFQIALALYFLWDILGPSVFAGVGVLIILIPINLVLREYVRSCQVEQMASKDERVKLISEIITGIKILKLYAWEPSFQDEILKIRQKEINTLKKTAYLQAVFDFLWSCCQFMVAVSTFATYVLVDETHVLNAQTVFVSLALFNAMNFPLTLLPKIIVLATQTSVSLGRLNKFLNAEEIDTGAISHDAGEACPIVIENGHFSWDRRDDIGIGTDGQAKKTGDGGDKNVLKNINISVQEGALVAVVGTVGSGKSSLLSAILGELEKTSGRVNTKGSISYVVQQPWIQNGTLRENVLFGKPFEAHNYTEVIESCALGPDLDIFPGRDKIEIGEKGINLSGGQKQRVSIARAVYNNSDLYLLDDPLSAVDSHVGKHIFENILSSNGLLRKKTRVFVTNSLHFLPQVDHVFVMKDGRISENGTYEELLKQKGEFFELVSQYNQEFDSENKSKADEDTASTDIFNPLEDTPRKKSIRFLIENGTKTKVEDNGNAGTVTKTEENVEEQEKLIQKERMETESVKWSTYIDYFRAAGWSRVFATVFFYAVYQAFSTGSNFWLTVWSNEPIINGTQGNRDLYLGVYTSLGVAQSVAFVLATTLMGLAALRSSSVLHFGMLTRVLKAPMSFFDTTPTGRILSRFSKDVDVMDSVLPMYIRILLYTFTTVLATLSIIIFSTPYFTLVIIPISIFYYFVQKFYVPTSRQLKRLESVTRSPIYSHFGETINGTSTIRAYGEQRRFISESDSKVDENQACYYPSIVSNRWLIVRLEAAGCLIIFFSAVFAVLNRDSLNPGLVGLTISYALQISFCLGTLVRTVCDFETNIVAAERIKEYGEVPQEEPWTYDWKRPESTWPAYGEVEFKNYQTRYRDGLDLVLNNITCRIEPGEKIGVVGRTGAGKSSLTLALFRIIEGVNEGSITIDGEDIRKLGLHDVRSRLTIIPQDPVLFSGTLRFNLDPFLKYSDSAVWRALELSNLKAFVGGLQGGLEFKVSEGGDNLSVGQKQLVCLSRALLRKSKILILDEATAAVDLETDELIQRTIRKEFKDSTVITIAHRLNTIMDSTRVMVINNGVIREFESPGKLLENHESQFYRMANDAGLISK